MNKPTKLTLAAAIAVLLSGGAAAAATGSLPTQADNGLSTAGDQTGLTLPESPDSHPTADDHPDDSSSTSSESSDVGATDANVPTTDHPDNHGADVSAVAQSDETSGRAHGEAVSNVARQNAGHDSASQASTASDDSSDASSN